jgi:hypothetical protein
MHGTGQEGYLSLKQSSLETTRALLSIVIRSLDPGNDKVVEVRIALMIAHSC